MGSSNQRASLFDPFRGCTVQATPEEIIRQKLLRYMTSQLGYPKELLSVEKQLSELPHLKSEAALPKRRADIICFAKDIHPKYSLFPLLLIECKEGLVGEEAKKQALGYNHYIQAPFVAIAGKDKVHLVHPEELDFLPNYSDLKRIYAAHASEM